VRHGTRTDATTRVVRGGVCRHNSNTSTRSTRMATTGHAGRHGTPSGQTGTYPQVGWVRHKQGNRRKRWVCVNLSTDSIHLRVLPAAAPRGSAQPDSSRTDYQLNTIPSSPKFCDSGRANMAKTRNHCETLQNPTSLIATLMRPPMASASRARLPMPPAHPSGPACAGSPPL